MSATTPLLDELRRVAGEGTFTFVTEWLGYLPFGHYCWIEVDGIDITAQLPSFDSADLARLVAEGQLVELEHHASNKTDSRTVYRLRS